MANRIDEFSDHFIKWLDEWRQKTYPPRERLKVYPTRNEPTVQPVQVVDYSQLEQFELPSKDNVVPITSSARFGRQGTGRFTLAELHDDGA